MDNFLERKVDIYGDEIGGVAVIQSMGEDITPVNAARASLDQFSTHMGDREIKLSKFLVKEGHTSTAEHNVLTFWIKVPMFVARQHMRHRTMSYNEISRRYTSEKLEFYFPKELRLQDTKNRQASLNQTFDPLLENYPFLKPNTPSTVAIHYQTEVCKHLYEEMISKGVAREQARMVLPQNIYTTYWATANLHNWIGFISKRDHADAQWEMRLLAKEISRQIRGLWPNAHANYVEYGKINNPDAP